MSAIRVIAVILALGLGWTAPSPAQWFAMIGGAITAMAAQTES